MLVRFSDYLLRDSCAAANDQAACLRVQVKPTFGNWYGNLACNLSCAIVRSALCGVLILLLSTGLNRIGFRIKL